MADQEHGAVIELPVGLFVDGKYIKEAEIRRLTGKARKELARPEIRNDSMKAVEALLHLCLIRIGDYTTITKDIMDALFVADRDYIVLKTREISTSKDVTVQGTCPACRKDIQVDIPLDKIRILRNADSTKSDEKGPYAEFEVGEHKAEFYYPRGRDLKTVARFVDMDNPVEVQYGLYGVTVRTWDGVPIDGGMEHWDSLDIETIEDLQEAYEENTPGVDSLININCHSCSRQFSASIEVLDFLFRASARKRKR